MKKNKLDLKKLSKQLDDALNSESSESLNNWIMEQRISDNIVSSIRKHKISNLNKCLIEAIQFISALHRQFWLGAVISRFSSQIKNNDKRAINRTLPRCSSSSHKME